MLTVTVVVPTRDRPELLESAVRSLSAQRYPAMEIVVADQSVDERAREVVLRVAACDPRVRVSRSATVGVSNNRNQGVATSTADVIAFTDDDCVVADGWVEAIAAEFTASPEVDAVFGRMLPHGEHRRNGLETDYKPRLDREELSGGSPPWWAGHGGNMAVRRRTLERLAGFDPVLGAGAPLRSSDDQDIVYRILRHGGRVAYTPHALVYHRQRLSWPARRRAERDYGIGTGALMAKHLRCGDLRAVRLLALWIWQLGVRRIGAGLLKWRDPRVVYLGWCQLVYPWLGVARSLGQPVDRVRRVYRS